MRGLTITIHGPATCKRYVSVEGVDGSELNMLFDELVLVSFYFSFIFFAIFMRLNFSSLFQKRRREAEIDENDLSACLFLPRLE